MCRLCHCPNHPPPVEPANISTNSRGRSLWLWYSANMQLHMTYRIKGCSMRLLDNPSGFNLSTDKGHSDIYGSPTDLGQKQPAPCVHALSLRSTGITIRLQGLELLQGTAYRHVGRLGAVAVVACASTCSWLCSKQCSTSTPTQRDPPVHQQLVPGRRLHCSAQPAAVRLHWEEPGRAAP